MGTAEITRSNFNHDFFSLFSSPGDGVPQRLRGLDTKPSQMMGRIATELQNALSTTQEVPPHHEITDQLMTAADPADGSTSVPDTESDLKTPPPPSWPPEWSPQRLLDVLSRPGSFAIPQGVWLAADEAPEWVPRDYVLPERLGLHHSEVAALMTAAGLIGRGSAIQSALNDYLAEKQPGAAQLLVAKTTTQKGGRCRWLAFGANHLDYDPVRQLDESTTHAGGRRQSSRAARVQPDSPSPRQSVSADAERTSTARANGGVVVQCATVSATAATSTAAAFDAPRHLDRPRRASYG